MADSKRFKAVLFDLDDTLWPIAPVIIRAEQVLFDWLTAHAPAVARQFTIDSLRERRRALAVTNPRYRFDLWALRHAGLIEAFVTSGEDAALVDSAMVIFSAARNEVTLFEDVLPILQRLRHRVALGTISNGAADLDAIGLADYFQTSVAARHVGCGKPDSAIFHAACDALQISPADAVYVGDDLLIDIDGAQKAGMTAVWLNRQNQPISNHVRPDHICSTLIHLEHWLKERI